MNEFDALFNQYFGDNKNDSGMERMMKLIGRLNNGGGISGMSPEDSLGKPDTVREFEKDGVVFVESTWDTPQGTIVRVETKEDIEFTSDFFKRNNIPTGERISEEVPMTLEEKLEIAKEHEDYETCAELRDEIEARDKRKSMSRVNNILEAAKKRQAEVEKLEEDKNVENNDKTGDSEEDEWNF
jgi:hypothetical protein